MKRENTGNKWRTRQPALWVGASLIRAGRAVVEYSVSDVGAPRPAPITIANRLAWLDAWIAEIDLVVASVEHASLPGEPMTKSHLQAIKTVGILRELRKTVSGEE